MALTAAELRRLRELMVADQIEARGIHDPAVLAAMRRVPRERFVEERFRPFAYDDGPLPIGGNQTISQPYVVALMIASLSLKVDDRVLEIGTGSGYAAAILSHIVHRVYTVERLGQLAQLAQKNLASLGCHNIQIHQGDGSLGWPKHAPYDAIVVAAGGPRVPEKLKEQLAAGGRLVMPVGEEPRSQRLIRLTRRKNHSFSHKLLNYVRFVPLIGEDGWEDGHSATF